MSKNLRTLDTDVYFSNEKISIQGNIESIIVASGDKKFNISFDENGHINASEIKKDELWFMMKIL